MEDTHVLIDFFMPSRKFKVKYRIWKDIEQLLQWKDILKLRMIRSLVITRVLKAENLILYENDNSYLASYVHLKLCLKQIDELLDISKKWVSLEIKKAA